MRENKQLICNKILEALQETRQFRPGIGCNGLVELRYIRKEEAHEPNVQYDETVRPIFEDGTGKNGWYDINVSCDSGTALFMDISKQFLARM